ncbi:hypothetical protein PISMIDRAFT_113576 [Pisolithus microcarpus 441]|uniref:BTB domain-containing protein n=1 Tax=Pisolithus microcarpus 441 TaxID=765257 RepID=A0A0C9YI35_9AGAM|nr:hypothetical protein BKA83DRAFT_113576 [Pisolithus microcarpus]KIK16356.1 hypothetical protein PISMIDRAFT_113576 [Pisolithus microcarpus 441]
MRATHHPEFYHANGTFIIQVEQTLYKLNHDVLANESRVFSDLFLLIHFMSESLEGKSDDTPIFLEYVTMQAFDLFVELKFAW